MVLLKLFLPIVVGSVKKREFDYGEETEELKWKKKIKKSNDFQFVFNICYGNTQSETGKKRKTKRNETTIWPKKNHVLRYYEVGYYYYYYYRWYLSIYLSTFGYYIIVLCRLSTTRSPFLYYLFVLCGRDLFVDVTAFFIRFIFVTGEYLFVKNRKRQVQENWRARLLLLSYTILL